jgi:hypothetical protein
MKFQGLLLKESLQNLEVLKLIKIIKQEKWKIPKERLADSQPKIWTAITFEGDIKKIKEISQKMSEAIKPKWYLNIGTSDKEIVVFHNKIFEHKKEDKKEKEKVKEYGKSIGIPKCQMDY